MIVLKLSGMENLMPEKHRTEIANTGAPNMKKRNACHLKNNIINDLDGQRQLLRVGCIPNYLQAFRHGDQLWVVGEMITDLCVFVCSASAALPE